MTVAAASEMKNLAQDRNNLRLSRGVGGNVKENSVTTLYLVAVTLFRISAKGLVFGKVVGILVHIRNARGAQVEAMNHGVIKVKVIVVVAGKGYRARGQGSAPETGRL